MAIKYLTLWPTAGCNLKCVYCYRGIGYGVMSTATADAALDLAASSGQSFHLQIAGGEPTLAEPVVTHIVTSTRQRELPASIAIQTNATRLNPKMLELWRSQQVQVGVSIDGPAAIHDQLRGGFADTIAGLSLLAEYQIPVRVTVVVTSANIEYLDELALVLSSFSNIQGIGLDPLVNLGAAKQVPNLAATNAQVASGCAKLYRTLEALNRRGSRLRWRELEAVKLSQIRVSGCGAFCHAATGSSLAVAPNGQTYPCSQAVGDPTKALGHISELKNQPSYTVFSHTRLVGECESCALQGRCPGDCPSRLEANRSGTSVMCQIYRTIAELEGIQR